MTVGTFEVPRPRVSVEAVTSPKDGLLTRLKATAPVRAIGRKLVAAKDARERDRAPGKPTFAPIGAWSLRRLSLLSVLPAADVAELHAKGAVLACARRAVTLLDEDDARVWIVLEGGVKLCRVGALGQRLVEALLDPGDVFGRVSPGRSGSSYEVQALEPTKLLSVPRPHFETLLQRHPKLAFSVVQTLEDRQRHLVRRIEALVFKDVRARVAETLLELAREHAEPCGHGFAVDVRVNQQDLAELVGASRQMVNRVLGDLSRALYVQRMGRVICVLHRERLERLAAETTSVA